MEQLNPAWFHPGSPNELMLFLDSVITSSLCPHTKDWICFLYFHEHRNLYQCLNFWIHAVPDKDLFLIKYGGTEAWVPFCVGDFVSYLQDLPKPKYEILRPAEAQVVKRIFSKEWDLAAEKIVRRIPLPVRTETPTARTHIISEHYNPAVWFALKGKYTIANFLADRSLKNFIERHWRRLSFQFGNSGNGKWEYHNTVDRCRCPGYALPYLLVGEEANKVADAVLEEILSHVDPLIVDHLRPYIERFEEERRLASLHGLQNWYQPQGSARTWNHVARFSALEAVSDRLLIAFEDLSKVKTFRVMAEAWMQVM